MKANAVADERTTAVCNVRDAVSTRTLSPSLVTGLAITAAEDRQEQEEHVENVEKNRSRENRRGSDVLGSAQSLEVERRQTGKDHKADDCVDERTAGDLHKDEHDPEDDQSDERPVQRHRR